MDMSTNCSTDSLSPEVSVPTPINGQPEIRVGGASEAREQLISLLKSAIFREEDGLTYNEKCAQAYRQLAFLNSEGFTARRLWADPLELAAFIEIVAVKSPALAMLVATHHFLTFGAIEKYAYGREDLKPLIDDLDALRCVGTFVITEVGYGNSHARLKTQVRFDPDHNELILDTPVAAAQKIMSANGLAGVPKIGVVMARLLVEGGDRGVFPVLVSLRNEKSIADGISIDALPESPYLPMDYARLSFRQLHLPVNRLLHPNVSKILALDEKSASREQDGQSLALRENAWMAFALQLSAVGRATATIAVRHAYHRIVQSQDPEPTDTVLAQVRSHNSIIFEILAVALATMSLVNRAKIVWSGEDATGKDLGPSWIPGDAFSRTLSLVRVLAAKQVEYIAGTCSRRLGAQGIFGVNRVAAYHGLTNILHPAAGDVHLTSLVAMRAIGGEESYVPPLVQPKFSKSDLCDPLFWLYLSTAREQILQVKLRAAVRERRNKGISEQDLWNELFTLGRKTVDAHAQRLQIEAFVDFANAWSGRFSNSLDLFLVLHAIRVVEQDSAWYAANGLLSLDELNQLDDMTNVLCNRMFFIAPEIVDAFGLDDMLQVPVLDPEFSGVSSKNIFP